MTNQPGLTPNAALRGAIDLGALAAAREAQAKAAARAADPDAARVVIDVTEQTFAQDVVVQSETVPVLVDLWATWCAPCKQLSPILEKLAEEYAGRWVLAKVDVDASPQIAAAFRAQSIPTVVAVIKGQPVPLFQGALPEAQVREFVEEVLRLGAQHGVAGVVAGASAEPAAPAAEDPRWDEAADAIERGDWDAAAGLYEQLQAIDPEQARDALSQVELLRRIDGVDPVAAIDAADADPLDVAKACTAADAEVASGAADAAFARLIAVVRGTSGAERDAARVHLVGLFALVGESDPLVIAGRRALASALF